MRIASLLPSATEILAALGLTEQLVAVSHACDFPPQTASIPRVTSLALAESLSDRQTDQYVRRVATAGQSLYQLDGERLASLTPDLIVTQAQCAVCAIQLSDVERTIQQYPSLQGCRILTLQPQTLDDVWTDIQRIACAAERPAAGQLLYGQLQHRVECVQRATACCTHRRRVAIVEWINPLMLAGHWCPELVAAVGAEHGLTRGGAASPYVDSSALQSYAPHLIVVAPCGYNLSQTVAAWEGLTTLPGWTDLPAVQRGQVYGIDGNAFFNRSGPRLVDSLEILAHLLYPEEIAPPHTVRDADLAWRRLL